MKKKGLISLLILFSAFLFTGKVNASLAIGSNSCIRTDATTPQMTCDMSFVVSGDSEIKTGDEFTIMLKNPTHIINNEVKLTDTTGKFTFDGEGTKTYTLSATTAVSVKVKYIGTDTIKNTTIAFATASYVKDDMSAANCGFEYSLNLAGICKIVTAADGTKYYYGRSGELLESEAKYIEQCGCYKDETNNIYRDQNGNEVTKEQFAEIKECNLTCGIDKEGNYYNSKGVKVTEEEYRKDCLVCKIDTENNKYYDLEGKEVTEEEYYKVCPGKCHIKDGKYYNTKNEEITKEQYENECQENAKTGSFIPYVGIIAGLGLIASSTILVRKQNKLRKI